jgi:hypothetical protein
VPIRDVGDAMHEMKAGSKHIRTRAQAIAVGLKAEGRRRRSKPTTKRSLSRRRSR